MGGPGLFWWPLGKKRPTDSFFVKRRPLPLGPEMQGGRRKALQLPAILNPLSCLSEQRGWLY
jgi:hypothetical protein